MKIVLASNWFNHHEKFFCDAINSKPDVEFYFIQTERIPEERLKLGYQDVTKSTPYCICSYESKEEYERAIGICNEADALLLGSAPYEFIADRVRNNKLTFFYAERLFRKGLWHMLYPPTFFTVLKRFIIPGRKSNFYLLAASGYTAWDTSRIFAFNKRRFKWGHLIDVPSTVANNPKQQLENIGLKHQKDVSILWAGRLIGWKHPDMSIRVAKTLKERGVNFTLKIIGTGDMEKSLRQMITENNLGDCVQMLGAMQPTEVRQYMNEADVYLFTSDFNEGWGAVLGESMSSGCAVVTSHGIGATPFLVQHNQNGLIYETGNYNSFERNVIKLVESESLRERLGAAAQKTMSETWNPSVGADRFHSLCKSLIERGTPIYYEQGPISKAEILHNNWFKDDTI